jgi:antitoxin YefM
MQERICALIQHVCKNAEPTIIVGRENEEQAVLISLDDFQAMEETAYLLGSPANRAHLEKSLQEAKDGKFVEFSVEDL